REGLHPHGPGSRRARRATVALAVVACALPVGDEPSRCVRAGPCAPGIDEAGVVAGGRGFDGSQRRAHVSGDHMTIADDLHETFLTQSLSEQQLAELMAVGDEITITEGDELFREGQPSDHMWILLAGRVELSRNNNVLGTMATPGRWAGGLRAWEGVDGTAGYTATARCVEDGRMFRVPSDDLGRLVGEWFPFGKHLLIGVYQTVRTFEQTARQRASLVALGTLSAGMAHELNNPASASLRAVEALRENCDKMMLSLGKLGEKAITAEQSLELTRLRRELLGRPAPDIGAVGMMEREDAIGGWLERQGMAHPWAAAPVLAAAGADLDWLQDLDRGVGRDALVPAVGWVAGPGREDACAQSA